MDFIWLQLTPLSPAQKSIELMVTSWLQLPPFGSKNGVDSGVGARLQWRQTLVCDTQKTLHSEGAIYRSKLKNRSLILNLILALVSGLLREWRTFRKLSETNYAQAVEPVRVSVQLNVSP